MRCLRLFSSFRAVASTTRRARVRRCGVEVREVRVKGISRAGSGCKAEWVDECCSGKVSEPDLRDLSIGQVDEGDIFIEGNVVDLNDEWDLPRVGVASSVSMTFALELLPNTSARGVLVLSRGV